MSPENLIDKAAQIVAKAKRLVAFTGSGVSAESGIATFRDPGGIWDRFDPDLFRTSGVFLSLLSQKQDQLKALLEELLQTFEKAKPNPGHLALVELERLKILRSVITQNIDNIHREAGNTHIIELHGNIYRFRCLVCHSKQSMEKGKFLEWLRKIVHGGQSFELSSLVELLPKCRCGNPTRNDVVMFGEPVQEMNKAIDEAKTCDVMLVLGTSGVVYPAAILPQEAKKRDAKIIDVNPAGSSFVSIADVVIKEKSGVALPKIIEGVKKII